MQALPRHDYKPKWQTAWHKTLEKESHTSLQGRHLYIFIHHKYNLLGDQVRTGKDIKQIIKNINRDINSYKGDMYRVTFDMILEGNALLQVQVLRQLSMAKWDSLKVLNISFCELGPEAFSLMKKARWTNNLTKLDISHNPIKDEGFMYLSQNKWDSLQKLFASTCDLHDLAMKYFSRVSWPSLTSLSLDNNEIFSKGCLYLSKAHIPKLRLLNLNDTWIGNKGIFHLSHGNWKYVSSFSMESSCIQYKGCQYLTKTQWSQLFQIYAEDNEINFLGHKLLKKMRKHVRTNYNLLSQIDRYIERAQQDIAGDQNVESAQSLSSWEKPEEDQEEDFDDQEEEIESG